MGNIQLRSLLSVIQPYVPQVSEFQLTHFLRLSAIEFCERTCAWRHLVRDLPHVSGEVLTIIMPYAALHKVEFAEFDGCPLTPVAFTDITEGGYESGTTPKYITQVAPQSLAVVPDGSGAVTVSMFLKPIHGHSREVIGGEVIDDFDQVPEYLVNQWGEVIVEGALGRLFAIPNRPWSNQPLGQLYRDKFDRRAINLTSSALRGQQRAVVRTKTQWF